MSRPPDIYAITWNDAVFASLAVRPLGIATIEFSQMCFYFYASPRRESVIEKEYRTTLLFQGTTSIEIVQAIGHHDLVHDGAIFGQRGERMDLGSALDVVAVKAVEVSFISGCSIRLQCSAMKLEVDFDSEPVTADLEPRPVRSC